MSTRRCTRPTHLQYMAFVARKNDGSLRAWRGQHAGGSPTDSGYEAVPHQVLARGDRACGRLRDGRPSQTMHGTPCSACSRELTEMRQAAARDRSACMLACQPARERSLGTLQATVCRVTLCESVQSEWSRERFRVQYQLPQYSSQYRLQYQ